jgi:hypothetical protein
VFLRVFACCARLIAKNHESFNIHRTSPNCLLPAAYRVLLVFSRLLKTARFIKSSFRSFPFGVSRILGTRAKRRSFPDS